MNRRALAWLAFLAPFFYATYGAANALAARHDAVPSIVFSWERHIPFVAWTIVPYWTINLFYAASPFLCATREEVDAHGRRLLTAQLIAVACFIVVPLKFTGYHAAPHGIPAALFALLNSFDRPFNQAPSLHIALLVILWPFYVQRVPKAARWPLHAWFALVGVSVLTTYQHHFFDVPTGALLGLLCLWIWPAETSSPLMPATLTVDRSRLALAFRYLSVAILLVVTAARAGGTRWWLLWPAASLVLVSANYAFFGPNGFQKDANGRMPLPARLVFGPYIVGALINSRLWTLRNPQPVPVAGGVWVGRFPIGLEAARFATVIDMSAELPRMSIRGTWRCVPLLDLVTPEPSALRTAAIAIERARFDGPVLVCCAVGYARSAAAVAAWLLLIGGATTAADAIQMVRHARPGIVIRPTLQIAIAAAAEAQ